MRSSCANAANQSFSRLLRDGEGRETDDAREQAIERVVELMRRGLPIGGRRFTRDEMHER
jgi:hypothetical protein